MREHGLDFSTSASTDQEAILFTHEPFAAVSFFDYGTDEARNALAAIKHEIDESWRATSDRHIEVPNDKELWPFQKADVEYALRRRNTLIGDMPGLGKTEVAIAYCNELRSQRNLVICPAQIRLQWAQRIREWSTMRNPYVVYPITRSASGVHPRAEWTIVSYDLARTKIIGALLAAMDIDVLILDEPHYLKETDSQRTRAIFGGGRNRSFAPLASRAKSILGLTGTPLPNRPREAFTLARGLCHDSIDWMSEERFCERFNPSQQIILPNGRRFIDERSGRHFELQNRMRASFMVRHVKHGPQGVMSQLKMPIYDLVQVEETGPVKQALKAESLLDIDPENLAGADMTAMGHIAEVRHMMGIAIAPQVVEYAKMLLEGGEEKLTIFGWHIDVLDILQKGLSEYGVVRIDGSTSAIAKDRLCKQFQYNDNIRVVIGNILSMGIGTDGLQHVCNHGLIAEPDWVPGNNIQCFDRLDRGGQRSQVQGDIFVAPGSIAEKVLASALRKGRNIHKVLDAHV